jgi:hypothetical protein
MDQKKDHSLPEKQPDPAEPRKRFRIEKIEERIAPGGHYNPHSKWVGDGGGGGGSSNSGSGDSYSGRIYLRPGGAAPR